MTAIKAIAYNFSKGAPFVISNTIIFIPYLLFLRLNNGTTLGTAMPFVLFYAFRMTGIFLLKSFNLTISSLSILTNSILIGVLGCLFGMLGEISFSFYYISAVLIGLSAAWFPAANTTVEFHEKQQGYSSSGGKKYLYVLLIFIVLLGSLAILSSHRMSIILAEYVLLYIAVYYTVSRYNRYEINFDEVNKQLFSVKELAVFISFFIILLFIRSARLILEPRFLTIGVVGFSIIFVVAAIVLNQQRKAWKLPLWLNLVTFVNGMCMNFLLLFGTVYVSLRLGTDRVTMDLYIPFILGVVIAPLITKRLYRLFKQIDPRLLHIYGFIISLCLMLSKDLFPYSVFLLSVVTNATGAFLNNVYYEEEALPKDQRIIAKYSTQMKGSIVHQLLSVSLLWLLTQEKRLPVTTVFQITQHHSQEIELIYIVEEVHIISILFLLALCLITFYQIIKENRGKHV